MSTENDKATDTASNETPTTHSRKAQVTAVILVGVVVAGLIMNTAANYSKKEQRQADRAAEEAKAEAKGVPRPERSISDFATEQQQAAQAIDATNEANKEDAERNSILETIAKSGGTSTGDDAQEKLQSVAAVKAEFEAEERKRVLAAMRGAMGRATGGRELANAQPEAAPSPLARVDEQINALSASQQGIAQRQRALIERAQAMGVNLPGMMAGNVGGAAMMPTSTTLGAANPTGQASPASQATFGELGTNRAARDPINNGPKPGEKIVPTGTIVSAVLDMDMISDYAGNWIALVQRPVYDVELENILIPAGTKIVGKSIRATGANEFIQNRMGAVPVWAIRPDGKRIDFRRTSSMDAAGVAALQGSVDRHFLAQFMGIGAYAIIGLGPSLNNFGSEPESSRDAFVREATGKSREIGRSFAEKYLNVVPTQRVFAGTPVKIFIEDDIYITPWAEIDATHFNIR